MIRSLSIVGLLFAGAAHAQGMCCSDVGPGGSTVCCPGGGLCCGSGACAICRPEPDPGNSGGSGGGTCPDSHPVDCGGGNCCPASTVCCPGMNACAPTLAACQGPVCPSTHPVECGNGRCCAEDSPNCCPGGGCCDAKHPVCCGNGRCCDSAHSFCCPGGGCASSLSGCPNDCPAGYAPAPGVGTQTACCPIGYSYACSDGSCGMTSNCHGVGLLGYVRPPAGGGGGPGCGPPSGGCSSLGADFQPAQQGNGCCTYTVPRSVDSCSDACLNAWYECRGSGVWGPCQISDQACMMRIANAAVAACK